MSGNYDQGVADRLDLPRLLGRAWSIEATPIAAGCSSATARRTPAYPRGLYDPLRDRLGSEEIFKDIDTFAPATTLSLRSSRRLGPVKSCWPSSGKEGATACENRGSPFGRPERLRAVKDRSGARPWHQAHPRARRGTRMPAPDSLPASLVPVTIATRSS